MDSDDGYFSLACAIVHRAAYDYVTGDKNRHRNAAVFFRSGWSRFLFGALDIDTDAALEALVKNRKEYVNFLIRKRIGDRSAQNEFAIWWKEHFHYPVPDL